MSDITLVLLYLEMKASMVTLDQPSLLSVIEVNIYVNVHDCLQMTGVIFEVLYVTDISRNSTYVVKPLNCLFVEI